LPALFATLAGKHETEPRFIDGRAARIPAAMIVLDNVLNAQELATVREFLKHAEFVDGKMSADVAITSRKENQQLKRDSGAPLPVDQIIAQAFIRHPILQAWATPMRMSTPLFNRYSEGMFYRDHIDSPVRANPPLRCDISLTLFLSDPADYDGGELVVESPAGPSAVKLPAGSAFAYTTNALHRVNKITRGERLACVSWFQSMVPDDRLRGILFDLAQVEHALAQTMKEAPAYSLLTKATQNLMRLAARL
jgi:PKHD-type hydroxylase